MSSFRKEIRTLASKAVDGLKKEVKGHFKDLPPWEDYNPECIERYEAKLRRRERRESRQRRQAEAIDDRRHAKEYRHRQRRHQINEHYNRSSTKHRDEREHKHGVPRVVQPEHEADSFQRSGYSSYQIPEEQLAPCYEYKDSRRSGYAMTAKKLPCNERFSLAPPKGTNKSKMTEQEVPIHEPKGSRHSSSSTMTAKEVLRNGGPSIPPRRGSKRALKKKQGEEPRKGHQSSSRVSDQHVEPKSANDHADEFRPLRRAPSSVYSSYSDDDQRTVIGNPTTQETSTLGGQDHYTHQPISQQDDGIWDDDLDDWNSDEEELLTTIKETHDKLNQKARIDNWRNDVWEGNPEPCSDPSFVTEPRPQSTLERIGNIRLANMSTASVTTRFSEFC